MTTTIRRLPAGEAGERPTAVSGGHAPHGPGELVDRYLAHHRVVIADALVACVPARGPRRYLYDLVVAQLQGGGKAMRPALCLATCRALGGSLAHALPSALALELLHNAFLVHDDVEDGSEYRRGRPTLQAEHGVGIAVNVGDAISVLSTRVLSGNVALLGPALSWRIFDEVQDMLLRSVEGQAIEMGWIRENRLDLADSDYLRMVLHKTCWYTCIHPCRVGALVASGGSIDAERFDRFGFFLGAAFQIQDDLLNLVGDDRRYGKEIGGDIWEGKRTLALVHVVQHCSDDERERLRAFLALPRTDRLEREVRWVRGLMDRYLSIDHMRSVARQLAEAALAEFAVAFQHAPETNDKAFIRELVRYAVRRQL